MGADEFFTSLPAIFGRYRVVKLLGKGGMGAVYLADDTAFQSRQVAIKIPTRQLNEIGFRRFQREANSVAVMDHPNICPIYDHGTENGLHFIAMKYVPGHSLADVIGTGKEWDERSAVVLVEKLTLAMQYAHNKGIIHRDLKPANVMILGKEPIIMDFGLALWEQDETLTDTGTMIGTPAYMPLEQARGIAKEMGTWTDVYALGVILFEMLTGSKPYSGTTVFSILTNAIENPTPLLRTFRPNVDSRLEAICALAMAKDWKERYPRMSVFAKALSTWKKEYKHEKNRDSISHTTNQQPARQTQKAPQETLPDSKSRKVKTAPAPPLVAAATDVPAETSVNISPQKSYSRRAAIMATRAAIVGGCGALSYLTWSQWSNRNRQRLSIPLARGLSMAFSLCPAGQFRMGSSDNGDELPVHTVTISKDFYAGVFPVTQAEYQVVMGTNPSIFKDKNRPVENVSWNEAKEFCAKLSKSAKREIRLPSEAEWEYLCRAGSTTRYCSGDTEDALSTVGWFDKNSNKQTQAVGALASNAWGIYDCHGNVFEWCEDWYDSIIYQRGDCTDPIGPRSGKERVNRGGGWNYPAGGCRSAIRGFLGPNEKNGVLGFRCVFSGS